jgi:ferredoxin
MEASKTIAQPRCFTKTVKDRCHVCYTCVRGCPAKAIRILDRQAEIVADRCIGCGNCVRVCGRGAKKVVNTVPDVEALLAGAEPVAALVAPSFPAEFYAEGDPQEPEELAGMLRALGFAHVTEVGFGADLVAHRYRKLLDTRRPASAISPPPVPPWWATSSAIGPSWSGIWPLVSPMVAMARVLRQMHGPEFAHRFHRAVPGQEGRGQHAPKWRARWTRPSRSPSCARCSWRAGSPLPRRRPAISIRPIAGTGTLFPLNRGLFQAAGISEDLASTEAVAAHGGPASFVNAIEEFAGGDVDFGLVEVLCCNGCVSGPGMTTREKTFRRRARVAKYAKENKHARALR